MKYLVRYRAVGDLNWTTKSAGAGSGLCNVGLDNTVKVLRNLNPSTTYEYKMKAFYCGPFGGTSLDIQNLNNSQLWEIVLK